MCIGRISQQRNETKCKRKRRTLPTSLYLTTIIQELPSIAASGVHDEEVQEQEYSSTTFPIRAMVYDGRHVSSSQIAIG
jgi:hypothetical protein